MSENEEIFEQNTCLEFSNSIIPNLSKDKQKIIYSIKKRKKLKFHRFKAKNNNNNSNFSSPLLAPIEINILTTIKTKKKMLIFKKSLGKKIYSKNQFHNNVINNKVKFEKNSDNKSNKNFKIQKISGVEIIPTIERQILKTPNTLDSSLNYENQKENVINMNNNFFSISNNICEDDLKMFKDFMNDTVYSFENTNKILELLLFHNTLDNILLTLYKQKQNFIKQKE